MKSGYVDNLCSRVASSSFSVIWIRAGFSWLVEGEGIGTGGPGGGGATRYMAPKAESRNRNRAIGTGTAMADMGSYLSRSKFRAVRKKSKIRTPASSMLQTFSPGCAQRPIHNFLVLLVCGRINTHGEPRGL